MYKSTRRLTVLTAVVFPIVTLTTAALADDDKTYPGAMCRSAEAATAGLRVEDGALLNQAQREQTWICPIVRHQVTNDPEFARITVQEDGSTTPERQVRCQFVARNHKGEKFAEIGHTKRSEPEILQTNPLQVLVLYTWAGGEDDVLSEVPDHGYYFFRCVIPARTDQGQLSGVITYKVSEND
jgi:hypothetical protein